MVKTVDPHLHSSAPDAFSIHQFLTILREDLLGLPATSADELHEYSVDGQLPSFSPYFRDEYLLREVARKYPDWDTTVDRRAAALESFYKDEERNAKTNDRLASGLRGDPRVNQVILSASRKMLQVLGDFRSDWWLDGLRFGPGATTSLTRRQASKHGKLLHKSPHVGISAVPLLEEAMSHHPMWLAAYSGSQGRGIGSFSPSLVIRNYDTLTCVPKNAETDRTIGIGPDWNIVMQLAVGYCMRKKMSRWGININDQSINQRRARQASIDGKLVTVDLKSASNSVTTELVWQLLGNVSEAVGDRTWYKILDALRVPCYLVDGTIKEYSLFSAMGNGYTFELETLIFWSLAHCTCTFLGVDPDVTVYGDDIIMPVTALPLFREVLAYSGFLLNEKKSHWGGGVLKFRESCGKHYLNGVDCTPFYIDGSLTRPDELVVLANNIIRWARLPCFGKDSRLKRAYDYVVGLLPQRVKRCLIPFSEDDDGLISDWDEARPTPVRAPTPTVNGHTVKGGGRLPSTQYTFYGYRVSVFHYSHREKLLDGWAGLITCLYNGSQKRHSPNSREWWDIGDIPTPLKTASSQKKSIRFRKRVVTSWDLIGPWL